MRNLKKIGNRRKKDDEGIEGKELCTQYGETLWGVVGVIICSAKFKVAKRTLLDMAQFQFLIPIESI